jgi:hypothetical protein
MHGKIPRDATAPSPATKEWQATEHMRLDEDKLEALRRWGRDLQQSGSEEDSPAGRAILMLVEEIEQLHGALWHARQQLSRAPAAPHDEADADAGEPFASTLHGRLQRVLRRDSSTSAPSRSEPVEEAGAQAWIESLRRHQ